MISIKGVMASVGRKLRRYDDFVFWAIQPSKPSNPSDARAGRRWFVALVSVAIGLAMIPLVRSLDIDGRPTRIGQVASIARSSAIPESVDRTCIAGAQERERLVVVVQRLDHRLAAFPISNEGDWRIGQDVAVRTEACEVARMPRR